jgi:hypothetical protein
MATTADILPGMTIRLIPANKKNRQTITVTKVETLRTGALVLGTRKVEAGTRYERDRVVCVIVNNDTAVEVIR